MLLNVFISNLIPSQSNDIVSLIIFLFNRPKPVSSSRTNSCDTNLSRLITKAPSSSKPKCPSWKRPTGSSSTRNTRATPPFETLKPNWPAWKRCEIYSEGCGLEIKRNSCSSLCLCPGVSEVEAAGSVLEEREQHPGHRMPRERASGQPAADASGRL